MKLIIPQWMKTAGGYVLAGGTAILWLFAGANDPKVAQATLDEIVRIAIAPDTTETIQARRDKDDAVIRDTTGAVMYWDTTKHATTENDYGAVYRARGNDLYADGYTQYIWNFQTINRLTDEVSPQILLTILPKIGTQVNWKARTDKGTITTEKIPEKLDALPLDKAEALGWAKIADTLETAKKDSTVLSPRWTVNKDEKGKRVEYKAAVAEEMLP